MSTLRVVAVVFAAMLVFPLTACDTGGSGMKKDSKVPQEWRGNWEIVGTENQPQSNAADFWNVDAQQLETINVDQDECEIFRGDLAEVDDNTATFETTNEGETQEVVLRFEDVSANTMRVVNLRSQIDSDDEGARIFFEKMDRNPRDAAGCNQ